MLQRIALNASRRRAQHGLQFLNFNMARMFATETVKVPKMGDSITEGTLASLVKQPGEFVEADEIVAVIDTDKVSVDIRSPHSGVISEYMAAEGDQVEVDADFFKIDTDGKPGAAAAAPPKEAPKEAAPEAPKAAAAPPPPKAAPVSSAPATPPPAPQAKQQTAKAGQEPKAIAGSRSETRVAMSRMRQTIAKRLKDSQNTYASLTTFNEIDMSYFMQIRKDVQEAFVKKHDCKLGFMSAFVKASVAALQEQPSINAVIEGNEIIYRDYVDISVAVATPKGLVVPVLRNCQDMGYADVEKGLIDLAVKAREGKIQLEDMTGGTFTISNGGVYGSMMGTPIINAPQSAILGMHGIQNRPVVVGSSIVARPMMYVALTYDHRMIDGREAVLFLRKIKSCVEDPKTILFDL